MSRVDHCARMNELTAELLNLVQSDEVDQLAMLGRVLAELVAVAAAIPESDADLVPTPGAAPESLRLDVARSFPSLGLYWTVYMATDTEAVPELLSGYANEDIVEILGDLLEGARAARSDEQAGLWVWRHGFRHHWGRHVARVQGVITELQMEGAK